MFALTRSRAEEDSRDIPLRDRARPRVRPRARRERPLPRGSRCRSFQKRPALARPVPEASTRPVPRPPRRRRSLRDTSSRSRRAMSSRTPPRASSPTPASRVPRRFFARRRATRCSDASLPYRRGSRRRLVHRRENRARAVASPRRAARRVRSPRRPARRVRAANDPSGTTQDDRRLRRDVDARNLRAPRHRCDSHVASYPRPPRCDASRVSARLDASSRVGSRVERSRARRDRARLRDAARNVARRDETHASSTRARGVFRRVHRSNARFVRRGVRVHRGGAVVAPRGRGRMAPRRGRRRGRKPPRDVREPEGRDRASAFERARPRRRHSRARESRPSHRAARSNHRRECDRGGGDGRVRRRDGVRTQRTEPRRVARPRVASRFARFSDAMVLDAAAHVAADACARLTREFDPEGARRNTRGGTIPVPSDVVGSIPKRACEEIVARCPPPSAAAAVAASIRRARAVERSSVAFRSSFDESSPATHCRRRRRGIHLAASFSGRRSPRRVSPRGDESSDERFSSDESSDEYESSTVDVASFAATTAIRIERANERGDAARRG